MAPPVGWTNPLRGAQPRYRVEVILRFIPHLCQSESCPTRCEPGGWPVIPTRNEPEGGLGMVVKGLMGSPQIGRAHV